MTFGRLPFRHNRAVAHMNLELLEKCAQDFHKSKTEKKNKSLKRERERDRETERERERERGNHTTC